jgi:hypothetical protein
MSEEEVALIFNFKGTLLSSILNELHHFCHFYTDIVNIDVGLVQAKVCDENTYQHKTMD